LHRAQRGLIVAGDDRREGRAAGKDLTGSQDTAGERMSPVGAMALVKIEPKFPHGRAVCFEAFPGVSEQIFRAAGDERDLTVAVPEEMKDRFANSVPVVGFDRWARLTGRNEDSRMTGVDHRLNVA
jgi:hypothetical protein